VDVTEQIVLFKKQREANQNDYRPSFLDDI